MNPEHVYHIAARADWQAAGAEYRPASLASEGFVHCSRLPQVATIANRFYAEEVDLVVLVIDPARLSSPVRDEEADGEFFPHVYGPIERPAVVEVRPLRRDAQAKWAFP